MGNVIGGHVRTEKEHAPAREPELIAHGAEPDIMSVAFNRREYDCP
jgi:hypothetical protein